jgi:hypothetical protein
VAYVIKASKTEVTGNAAIETGNESENENEIGWIETENAEAVVFLILTTS